LSELVRFETGPGRSLTVEVADNDYYGVEQISRDPRGIIQAGKTLEDSLSESIPALQAVEKALSKLAPHAWEVEFGIKLNAEAGMIVAKTALEGHFTVKLSWKEQEE
jgi:hypothetical protein